MIIKIFTVLLFSFFIFPIILMVGATLPSAAPALNLVQSIVSVFAAKHAVRNLD